MKTKVGRRRVVPEDAKSFLVRLPADLHTELRTLAGFRKKSLNSLVWDALGEWVADQDEHEYIVKLSANVPDAGKTAGTFRTSRSK